MRISSTLLAILLITWLPVRSATALTITLNGGGITELMTNANDKSGADVNATLNPTTLSYSNSSSAVDGGAASATDYDLADGGFSITFDHSRVGTYLSIGISYGNIFFSSDQDLIYTASGAYSATDADPRYVNMKANIYDLTDASDVFDSFQISKATPDESFTLGLTEGDHFNNSIGSLTGTLIAGHEYQLFYSFYIQAFPTGSTSGATASGNFSLSFAPVPEPGTALLVGLGLAGLALRGHRR